VIRLSVFLALQAFALFAGWPLLAPAAAAGAFWLAIRPGGARRVLPGAALSAAFFASACLLAGLERWLGWAGRPEIGRYGVLALRAFASFLVASAAVRSFTLIEMLCLLKRLRVPGYLLTMIYLMVQDLSVLSRQARAAAETIRIRGAGAGGSAKIRLLAHAAAGFTVAAAVRFRRRHEHMDARGLGLDLPLEAWRARERLPAG